jgi:hypothetical protein
MPPLWRSAVLYGIAGVVVIGVLQDLTALVLQTGISQDARRFFFGRSGLTTSGAAIVFVIPFLYSLGRAAYDARTRGRVAAPTARSVSVQAMLVSLVGVALLLIFPLFFGRFPSEVANNVMLLGIMMGLGLNIVVGFAECSTSGTSASSPSGHTRLGC